jgi:hypothetical protein
MVTPSFSDKAITRLVLGTDIAHILGEGVWPSMLESTDTLTKDAPMNYANVMTYARASVLAGSLLLLPMTTIFAQVRDTPTAVPDIQRVETRVERDYTGLWGLLGLLGLAGLAGRRPVTVQTYTDARERSRA